MADRGGTYVVEVEGIIFLHIQQDGGLHQLGVDLDRVLYADGNL